MITVYRSADDGAEEDARAVKELLSGQGIEGILLDDTAPGVPSGAWEVQVAPADSARAEELVREARLPDEDMSDVDESPGLDAETVFSSESGTQFEALSVKSMLEASGIAAVLVGDSVLPNLAFEVQVAKDQAGNARDVIEQAQKIGAQAAEEEERSTEAPLNP